MISQNNKQIAINSILLYVRMLFTMWLNLYATRIVLEELGAKDFGVYGVVGSIVTLFTVINSGIVKAIQRFITYELGVKEGHPNEVFNTLLNITFIFAIITFILLECLGLWFLNSHANIPNESQKAAFWVFQFSVLTTIITLISNPYNALVIAHEKMNIFAYISILQTLLNFIAAYSLKYITSNSLFYYALFLSIIAIGIRIVYQIYCRNKFPESRYKFYINKNQLKTIGIFSGWATLDGGLNTITWQGVTIIFNLSFGVTVNAVYNIATQLKNAVLSFAQNVQKAIDPQITKSYASGDFERHCLLIYNGSKIEIFLIYLILIPFLLRTKYILDLWLGEIPEYTIIFCQLAIFMSLLNAGFEIVRTSVIATGRIRKFVIYPNTMHLLLLPICYIINRYFNSPILMMIIVVIIDYLIYGFRLYLASRISVFKLSVFIKKVIIPSIFIGIITTILASQINKLLSNNLIGLSSLIIINAIILAITIYIIGINKSERQIINHIIKNKLKTRK